MVAKQQGQSHFLKMNLKSKQTIQKIQTFVEHVLYTLGKNAISV